MRTQSRKPTADRPWSVNVARAEVPETGRRFDLMADEAVRAAVVKIAGLNTLPRLAAAFDVTRYAPDGLRVKGSVSATVGQTCVVTLDPVENEIDEKIDVVFLPGVAPASGAVMRDATDDDGPEALVNGSVDLGALAVEFLVLALDPYPRKPDAVFEPPKESGDGSSHPFAGLATLKRGKSEPNG